MATNNPLSGTIEFIEFHQPSLASGDYTLSVTQTVSAAAGIPQTSFPAAVREFSVQGPRFELDPQVVGAMFPPAGSLGEHSNVLPHLTLKRSTLPWERHAVPILDTDDDPTKAAKRKVPWLALLVFGADELRPEAVKTLTVADLGAPQTGSVRWPGVTPELGQHPDDKVIVIDVEASRLQAIVPDLDELRWLTHVRQPKDGTGKPQGDEVAVIVANRLPQSGQQSIVHLVSVEGRYDGSQIESDGGFNIGGAGPDDLIRLVSLKSWRFACASEKQSFNRLLIHLNQRWLFDAPAGDAALHAQPPTISPDLNSAFANHGRPLTALEITRTGEHWWIQDGPEQRYFLSEEDGRLQVYDHDPQRGVLRLPRQQDNVAERYLAQGYVPLPHATRQGNRTVSWYHGPLVPGSNTATTDVRLPVRAADQLVQYNEQLGMFDVSYAAAWELGRLMTLQSKGVSVSLFNWKRSHAQKLRDAEQQLAHLPFDGPAADLELPPTVSAWFEHLALLQSVPFNYLVPDERALPVESIRFFQVDPLWLECLLDGAFSIGRVLASDWKQEHRLSGAPQRGPVSGFLLRSDVVAGWPDLQVDGYDEALPDEEAVPDPRLLFNLDARHASDLNAHRITSEIQQSFAPPLSDDARVEIRRWSLVDHDRDQAYDLVKTENNKIDVRAQVAPTGGAATANGSKPSLKHLFSTDASSESELSAGRIPQGLRGAFDPPLSANSSVVTSVWLILDTARHLHYEARVANGALEVYREVRLPLLRMERVSQNVLLCLFEGIVQTVDIHQKPEALHFGVSASGEEPDAYFKVLRDPHGMEHESVTVDVPWRDAANGSRVVAIGALAAAIERTVNEAAQQGAFQDRFPTFTSAQLGLEMIEGVQKVRFVAGA